MPLFYEQRGAIAVLTMSRPEQRNAWGDDYHQTLRELLPELEINRDIRCVVLTGDDQGGAFCAGANLKDDDTHTLTGIGDFLANLTVSRRTAPFTLLSGLPKPVIAAVNGYAVGIGAIMTFCCDLIVASERAEWRLPQVSLGILPADAGSTRLARFVGKGLAMRAALGFPINSDEAFRSGLAQWRVPHEQLMQKAMEVAEHVAGLPPLAVLMAKESINAGQEIPLPWSQLADQYRFAALSLTEDKQEGHKAWKERHKPKFKGS